MYIDFAFEAVMGFLLLCAAALLILRNLGYRGVPVIAAMIPVVLIGAFAGRAGEGLSSFSELASLPELSEYASAALRVVGIGYLGGVGADVCKELGEVGIARCISLAARAELIIICVPYVIQTVHTLLEFINE